MASQIFIRIPNLYFYQNDITTVLFLIFENEKLSKSAYFDCSLKYISWSINGKYVL